MKNHMDKLRQLKEHHEDLKNKAMQLNAIIDNAKKSEKKYMEAANQKYQVNSIEQLDEKIKEIESKNEEKLNDYENQIKELQKVVQSKRELIENIQGS